jgi:hypothetical protein
LPPQEESRPFVWGWGRGREMFPPEPPVAIAIRPERRAAVRGAPHFGAAKRTLDGEHRSGTRHEFDERRSGNRFLLVGFEWIWFGTAGPMTAQEQTRRLITLIFAGRNRMVMIRRELPRTEYAGWVRKPFRTEREEGSPFRGPCAVIGAAVRLVKSFSQATLASLCCFSVSTAIAPMKPSISRPIAVTIWFLFLPRAAIAL